LVRTGNVTVFEERPVESKCLLTPPWSTAKVAGAASTEREVAMLGVMILVNQVMNVGATTFFALSGDAHSVKRFIVYQIIGGLFGLGINLSYAGLVHYSSVPAAAAVGIGLAFVVVQIVSSYLFLHAGFTPWQWFGVGLVFAGVLLIALARA
jgi:drug/metabolite transporter (DMT)-like permease